MCGKGGRDEIVRHMYLYIFCIYIFIRRDALIRCVSMERVLFFFMVRPVLKRDTKRREMMLKGMEMIII